MSFREFDTVVMKADMPSHGLRSGDVGAVVQVYSADAFEVEFVTASGRTQALVTLTTRLVGRSQKYSRSAPIRRRVIGRFCGRHCRGKFRGN
jgi:hypothetical protein